MKRFAKIVLILMLLALTGCNKEQVGSIGKSIAKDDKQITTNYGDIVLYSGNQIVIFYGSNSWAYTRLGYIDMSREELTDMLGNKDVTVTLEK